MNTYRMSMRGTTSLRALLAGLVLWPAAGLAQEAPAAAGPSELQEIVVTGSRVAREGFQAPTPTTIVSADTIAQRGQTNATEVLNNLPSFRASLNNTTAGPALRGAFASPDLRGMGASRTLLLVNGLRAVPTTSAGQSDLNLLPTLMIDRVEVVTGGASAGYGSDAVAGVVNIILKRDFEGLQTDVSVGTSKYGDNDEFRAGVLGGLALAGGKAHLQAGVEYVNNKGVGDQYERPWGRTSDGLYSNACAGAAGAILPASAGCAGNVANGLPQRLILPYVYVSNFTRGGLITNATGVTPANLAILRSTAFGPGGAPYTFQLGSPSNATQTVGAAVGNNPGAVIFAQNLALALPVERYSAYGRASYDLTDDVRVFADFTVAGYTSEGVTFPQRSSGATAIVIRADNAFLPASVRALLTPTSTISVSRETDDSFGLSTTRNKNFTTNAVLGLEGRFGDAWSWDASGQFGRNEFRQQNRGQLIAANFALATDAVVNNGQIVCRSSIANPGNGCVPFNIFGEGSPSAAAQAYARGTGRTDLDTEQVQLAANLRGEPFSTWAGKVSIAVGAEYRRETAKQTVAAIALANGFVATTSNSKPLSGKYNVKEAYFEAVVPLARDLPFAKSFDLNGAVRRTDYSTSGAVSTWKIGAVYEPLDGVKVRATHSRDIRAPNISELFTQGQNSLPNTLTNPFLGNAAAGLVPVVTSGNPDLKPEIAKTTTFGVVLRPAFLPRFSFSVDYYDIDLKDAISVLGNQVILNQCAAGNQQICPLVTFGPGNQILGIRNQSINIASLKFRGYDFEAAYRLPLAEVSEGLPGELTLSLLANRTIDAITNDGVTGPIERAGDLGNGGGVGRPKWVATGSVSWSDDRLTLGAQGRFLSKGFYDRTFAEGVTGRPLPGGLTISDNTVASRFYLNLNAAYDILDRDGRKLQVYGVVNNVFDKAPPIAPAGGGFTNPALYDVIGQTFKAGVRFTY